MVGDGVRRVVVMSRKEDVKQSGDGCAEQFVQQIGEPTGVMFHTLDGTRHSLVNPFYHRSCAQREQTGQDAQDRNAEEPDDNIHH